MNKVVTGKLGLEDLLLGDGTVVQDLGAGRHRTVSKINLGNLPFNETKTAAQAISELLDLLKSNDVTTLASNSTNYEVLAAHIAQINAIADKINSVDLTSANIASIKLVANKLVDISRLLQLIDGTEQLKKDSDYKLCKIQEMFTRASRLSSYMENLYADTIKPLEARMNMVLKELDSKIETAQAEIAAGCEQFRMFGSYKLQIETKPYCRTPNILYNHVDKTITWQVPTVKGDCSVVEVEGSINAEEVNTLIAEYIATHNITGDNNEAITVDDLEPVEG